eukprot:CAMPEP_0119390288 /NCGR_PEP_ID=MMETSP1334-20130426/112739_1 /TAXON_ID=127549 /ORGANISM="Calcidiscus leptoporus, Strain RCC1130" /LENGTH=48 /DNA_ID= /DNA_START= /DNA_END= /DNA_ORIENTATION=
MASGQQHSEGLGGGKAAAPSWAQPAEAPAANAAVESARVQARPLPPCV